MRRWLLPWALCAGVSVGCGQKAPPAERFFRDKPVAHWLQAVHDPNPKIRKMAVDVLGNVSTLDPAAIPALTEALADKDARVREAAVLALAKIGTPAASALPQIEELSKDADAKVREAAALAVPRLKG
ncbi:MAG: HEAT repeat domain-containing protein [Gemmataceae bacterium]